MTTANAKLPAILKNPEPAEVVVVTPEPGNSDSLKGIPDDELFELKAAGKIIYRLRISDNGKYMRTLDDIIYARIVAHEGKGNEAVTLKKIGHLDGKGEFVALATKLSKRERSKLKRQEKRNANKRPQVTLS